jgi:hypothetical protein
MSATPALTIPQRNHDVAHHRRGRLRKPVGQDRQAGRPPSQDERLATIADKLRKLHQSLSKLVSTAAERARQIGDYLNEAKRLCPHGQWLSYLESCEIPERYAQACMQVAKRWSEIEANPNGRSDLTLMAIRQQLAKRKPKALRHEPPVTETRAVALEDKPELVAEPTDPMDSTLVTEAVPKDSDLASPASEVTFLPESPADAKSALLVAAVISDASSTTDENSVVPSLSPQSIGLPGVETSDGDKWLLSLPLRARLEDPAKFDAAARLWQAVQPTLDDLRRILAPEEFELGRAALPLMARSTLRQRLVSAAFVNPPELWILCSRCRGKLTDRPATVPCPACDGCGFVITHPGDYREDAVEESPAA